VAKSSVECALQLLANAPATQSADHPLKSLQPLTARGLAVVSHRWDEVCNGRTWRLEKITITDDGRAELARLRSAETLKR
jgi:hypothetical protein